MERYTIKQMQKIDFNKPLRQVNFAKLAGVGRSRVNNAIRSWKIRPEADGMIIPAKPINKYFLGNAAMNFRRIMRLARTDSEIFKYYGTLLNKVISK